MEPPLKLFITDHQFVFQKQDDSESSLVIERFSSKANFVKDAKTQALYKEVWSILGVIELISGPYLLLVTDASEVGLINSKPVHKVKKVEILPFIYNKEQSREEEKYQKLLHDLLNDDESGFYFSAEYDLTNSFERQFKEIPTDERFYWNISHVQTLGTMFEEEAEGSLKEWNVCPLIQGFVSITKSLEVNDKFVEFALISRRGWKRAGTRYLTRGCDKEGNVTNYVETEQIIMSPDDNVITSYVQIRGSVPLYWSQKPNLQYNPPLLLKNGDAPYQKRVFGAHFTEQIAVYSVVSVLNLLKKHGSESKLGSAFQSQSESFQDQNSLHYFSFDVHGQCKPTDYSNLSILFNEIESDKSNFGHFTAKEKEIVNVQKGVFRTNCKDNLDRTNLVQSSLAVFSLWDQLKSLGIISDLGVNAQEKERVEHFHRNIWADNGDAVSTQYSGTGAIRGDYTRNGKQSLTGLINDGVNSVSRYYLNNFRDAEKQDSIYLFRNGIKNKENSPFENAPQKKKQQKSFILQWFIPIFHSLRPKKVTGAKDFSFVLFWIFVVGFVWKLFFFSGKDIADYPVLDKDDDEDNE